MSIHLLMTSHTQVNKTTTTTKYNNDSYTILHLLSGAILQLAKPPPQDGVCDLVMWYVVQPPAAALSLCQLFISTVHCASTSIIHLMVLCID